MKVLGSSTYLVTSIYYDSKGRNIQTLADNIASGVDIVTHQYDFSGKLLSSYTHHQSTVSATNVLTKNIYDHGGRILAIKKAVNGAGDKVIAQNSYDELGRLDAKQLGQTASGFLETLGHIYNIRGWLNGINKDYALNSGSDRFFGMELAYDAGYNAAELNGNISGIRWKSKGDGEQRSYGFAYDNANRLVKADFTQNNGGWNTSAGLDFSVSNLSYDANGNIVSLWQSSWKAQGSSIIDKRDAYFSFADEGLL